MRLYRELVGEKELFLGEKCVFFLAGGGYLEGVKGVLAFSEERAVFAYRSGLITIEGRGLEVKKVLDGDVYLTGEVRTVVYEKREGRGRV